jgi:uncharacterized protein YgiM (DUF1202 family)
LIADKLSLILKGSYYMKKGKSKIKLFVVAVLYGGLLFLGIAGCDDSKNANSKQGVGNEAKSNTASVVMLWVDAEDGLVLRQGPGTGHEKVCVIPYGDKVELLEEQGEFLTIQGRGGKWSKVKWADKTGWVFGGFLSEKKVEKAQINFIGGWEPQDIGEAFYFFDDHRCGYDKIGTEGGGSGTYSYDPQTGTVVMQLEGADMEGGTYNFSKTIRINWVDKTKINITSFHDDGRDFTATLYKITPEKFEEYKIMSGF